MIVEPDPVTKLQITSGANRGALVVYLSLVIVLTLSAMLPILISPHWGMFSDRQQIIAACEVLSKTHDISAWLKDSLIDLRPAVHWPDYLTWWILPGEPRAFYMVRCVLWLVTTTFTYLTCMRLCRSAFISFAASLFWFFARPTYEVIYTLDKGEIFISALFAFVIWLDVNNELKELEEPSSSSSFLPGFLVLTVAVCYAMFTKQTGQLLLLYAGLSLVARVGTSFFGSKRPKEVLCRELMSWSSGAFVIALAAWVAYEAYFVRNGGLTHQRYKEVNYSLSFMWQHMGAYLGGMPEFVVLFLGSLALILPNARKNLRKHNDEACRIRMALVLVCTATIGGLFLSAWKGNIVYGWFPLLSFLIPALSYGASCVGKFQRTLSVLFLVVVFSWLLPTRCADAQLQFQMDSVFDTLAPTIMRLHLNASRPKTVILPFDQPSSFELGNILRLALSHARSADEPTVPEWSDVANMIRFSAISDSPDDGPVTRLTPGLDKYFLGKDGSWKEERVSVGDLLVVPSGNVSPMTAEFRGIPMFYKNADKWIGWLGQLGLQKVFSTSKPIWRLGTSEQEISWVGFLVTKNPALSMETSDGGWMFDGAHIIAGPDLLGSTLRIQTRNSHRLQKLKIESEQGLKIVTARNFGAQSLWDIPLAKNQVVSTITPHEKPLFLIQDVKLLPGAIGAAGE